MEKTNIFKEIMSIIIFIIVCYLMIAFIVWDISWVINADWVTRILFLSSLIFLITVILKNNSSEYDFEDRHLRYIIESFSEKLKNCPEEFKEDRKYYLEVTNICRRKLGEPPFQIEDFMESQ